LNKNHTYWTHGYTTFYTNGAERVRIDPSGRVGIGTTTPNFPLHVNGAVGATNYYQTSSEAVKKGIRDLDAADLSEALEKVRQSRSVFFWYAEETSPMETDEFLGAGPEAPVRTQPHIGVIAESLPPELTEWNGEFSGGYALADMNGLLVAAVKALDRKVQECEATNEALSARLARVERILEALGLDETAR